MVVMKLGAYFFGATLKYALTLLVNIRLGWKCLPPTHPVAHFAVLQ
jgi:hypothetical protein